MITPATDSSSTILGGHMLAGPYERIFVEPETEREFVRLYLRRMNGSLEYVFTLEEYFGLRVIGLTSPLGNASVVSIDAEHRVKLPDYIQHTRQLYVVDDIDAVYASAAEYGVEHLQPRTPNIMGAQGRLLVAPGYIVELAEATNRSLFYPDPVALGYL